MGSLGNSWENYVLDHVFGNDALSAPDALFIALLTGDPAEDASGVAANEVSGGAYARRSMATWDAAASRATENTNEALFPEATADWGTITHFAIFSTLSDQGVNYMVAHGEFNTEKNIQTGDQARIAAGECDISVKSTPSTGGFSDNLANEMLDHIFMVGSYGQPSNWYVALSKANPTDDLSGLDEPTLSPAQGAYARVNMATWDAAAAGATENTDAITFTEATGDYGGEITHMAVFDHATNQVEANFLCYAPLTTSRTISTNDTPRFSAGDCDWSVT